MCRRGKTCTNWTPEELRLTNLVTTDAVAEVLPRTDSAMVPVAALVAKPVQDRFVSSAVQAESSPQQPARTAKTKTAEGVGPDRRDRGAGAVAATKPTSSFPGAAIGGAKAQPEGASLESTTRARAIDLEPAPWSAIAEPKRIIADPSASRNDEMSLSPRAARWQAAKGRGH